jgi:hypothetical protein
MFQKSLLRARVSFICIFLAGAFNQGRCVDEEVLKRNADYERWFLPGEMGHETGAAPPVVSIKSYLTRSFGGVEIHDLGAWKKANELGPHLNFSHNLYLIFPPTLAIAHPEYFPEENRQRIVPPKNSSFWNPDLGREDVANHTAQAASAYFRRHPEQVSFAVGINDALIYGESPETLRWVYPPKWFRGRPDYSDLIYQFTNRVADKVNITNPGKYIGSLAYYWCEQIPNFPIRQNVIPFLTADRSQGYDQLFFQEEKDLQARWAKAGPKRLGLYDYLYGRGFLIPRYHPHLLADNLRHARRIGFTDYFAEVFPNWGLDGPQPWLVAQLLLDPEASVEGLLAEYFRRYFQEAADPMIRFFDICERQWLKQSGQSYWLKHFRNESQAALFPPAVCRALRKCLIEAKDLAKSPRVSKRVKLVSDAFGVTERFVAFQNAKESLSRKSLCGELAGLEGLKELHDYRRLRSNLISYLVQMRYEEPLALYPSDFRDFFLNDPLFEATVSLLSATNAYQSREMAAVVAALKQIKASPVQAALRVWQLGADMTLSSEVTFDGQLLPERRIAGLTYGVSLPAGWQSRVEPAISHQSEWVNNTGSRVLHLRASKDTAIYRWVAATPGKIHQITVEMKGHLSPSAIATVTLGWLDAQHRHLSFTVMRMPEGQWDKWCELNQGAFAPPNAAWVGVGIRVQHLAAEDWVDLKNLCLRVERTPSHSGR